MVYGPTVNTKLNQEPTTPCNNNKQSISFEPDSPTSEIDEDFETSISYIVSNFVKVGDSIANTDTNPHAYKPIILRQKATRSFLAKSNIKQLKSNWKPNRGMVNQRVWVPRAPPTRLHPHPPIATTTDNRTWPFLALKTCYEAHPSNDTIQIWWILNPITLNRIKSLKHNQIIEYQPVTTTIGGGSGIFLNRTKSNKHNRATVTSKSRAATTFQTKPTYQTNIQICKRSTSHGVLRIMKPTVAVAHVGGCSNSPKRGKEVVTRLWYRRSHHRRGYLHGGGCVWMWEERRKAPTKELEQGNERRRRN